ncbi:MAG: 50S ribosomal protein L18e [Candidatus Korarchaeum sp.]|nr:50S ribosomal protein L18e [Candidatus Korarchaeum sp.]MDW8035183.1 50S ribosomal protein L18e [Candidatus Korarchaeum sp.]
MLLERRVKLKPTGPTNPRLVRMIKNLEVASKVNEAPIWEAVAERLRKPTRRRVEVNLWKIERYADGITAVLVPGKVLGEGEIRKPIVVAAAGFTREAKRKIEEAGGKALLLDEYAKLNPKGSYTRIVT